MSTVRDLQAQLDALRLQHVNEIKAAQATLSKLQEDLNYMQADTDDLEKEEANLRRQFGQDKGAASTESAESPYKDIIVQGLRGLVDCDDSKCCNA